MSKVIKKLTQLSKVREAFRARSKSQSRSESRPQSVSSESTHLTRSAQHIEPSGKPFEIEDEKRIESSPRSAQILTRLAERLKEEWAHPRVRHSTLTILSLSIASIGLVFVIKRANRITQDPMITSKVSINPEEIQRQERNKDRLRRNLAGIDLYKRNNLDLARKEFSGLLENAPKNASLLINMGMVSRKKGDLLGARNFYERAIDLDPDNSIAHNNLGVLNLIEGRADDAIEAFRRAMEVSPDYLDSILNMASAQEKKNNWTKAIDYYNRYISKPGSDPNINIILKKRIRKIYALSRVSKKSNSKLKSNSNSSLGSGSGSGSGLKKRGST